ncbi:MAG: hypothetical protein JNM70_23275 [Anaerolineae bacterium]|nr:hypothetical protein [Anaerolineae bacterium]
MAQSIFMGHVQLHERAWGLDKYPDRPTLDDILKARIVAFWRAKTSDAGYRITLHESGDAIVDYINTLLFKTPVHPPDRRLVKLFVEKEEVRIKGVKLILERAEAK